MSGPSLQSSSSHKAPTRHAAWAALDSFYIGSKCKLRRGTTSLQEPHVPDPKQHARASFVSARANVTCHKIALRAYLIHRGLSYTYNFRIIFGFFWPLLPLSLQNIYGLSYFVSLFLERLHLLRGCHIWKPSYSPSTHTLWALFQCKVSYHRRDY